MKRIWQAACFGLALIGSTASHAAEKVTIMYTATAPYMASFIAKEQGFFAKRGIDADFQLAANGSVIVSALVAGSVQVGTPTPSVFVQAVDNGIDVVALASTNEYPDTTRSGLVARKEANIKSPKDVEGKKVGVPGIGGFLDVVLRKWLKDNGADTSKVQFVEIVLPQTGDALKSGTVDAVASVDPFFSRALETGAGVLAGDYTTSLPAGTIASVYASTRDWATKHPDTVKAFQASIAEAVEFAKANPDGARAALAKYVKLPPEVIAKLPIPNLTSKVSPAQIAFWLDVGRDQGFVTGKVDPASVIVPWQAN